MNFAPQVLASAIRAHADHRGFPCVRVSTVAGKRWPYWGAVRYRVRVTRDGWPVAHAIERATSDRRSARLAEADAVATGRYLLRRGPGRLTADECAAVLASPQWATWQALAAVPAT